MQTEEMATARGDDPTRLTRREWGLLLILAAMQFTHILDFVIMMPLGPEFAEALGVSADYLLGLQDTAATDPTAPHPQPAKRQRTRKAAPVA